MNKIFTILLISLSYMAKKGFAQNVGVPNQAALTISPNDNFNFGGQTVAHYGLGWYNEQPNIPPTTYFSGFSGLRIFAEGLPRISMNKAGFLGMGVLEPATRLHLSGDEFITIGNYENSNMPKGIHFTGYRDISPNYFGASIEAVPEWVCCGTYPGSGYPGIKNIGLNFSVHDNPDQANSSKVALAIKSSGNIGIGTDTPKEKLSVNGKVRAHEVKVEINGWPDYVFLPEYKLQTLAEVEKQIKKNGHLPDIPSAKEIEAVGLELGEINKLLMKKVEELTLHLIEKDKEISHLKTNVLENRITFEKNEVANQKRFRDLELKLSELANERK